VGGTGFYLRALLDGLPHLPGRDESVRERLAAREIQRTGSVHRLLTRLDPAAASRIHPHDIQKTVRALEVRMLTRTTAPAAGVVQGPDGYRTLKVGLNPDRATLHEALDARAREMFRSGLVDEVAGLLASGCTGSEKPFESLGYRQTLEHLRGKLSIEEAIASTQLETRQYAKRQWTWFRRDAEVIWLDGLGNSTEVIKKAMELAGQHLDREG
jgi:tRNA dimethylallyltransferase